MEKCPECGTSYGVRGRRCYKCEAEKRWKPIPYFDKHSGYLRMRLPNRGKAVYFHRWLIEQHIGRCLVWPEVVHHVNGNKIDNRLENLQLTTASAHLSSHKKGCNKARMGWSHKYAQCAKCGRNDKKHRGHGLCSVCFSREYEMRRPKIIKNSG